MKLMGDFRKMSKLIELDIGQPAVTRQVELTEADTNVTTKLTIDLSEIISGSYHPLAQSSDFILKPTVFDGEPRVKKLKLGSPFLNL